MAKLNVFTKENLALYDSLIKQYINTGDAKAIKKVTLDGRTLSFFKSEAEGAVADYTLTIPEQDLTSLQNRIKSNEDAIAAINNENTGILVQAKGYTDAEVKKLADGAVADNTAAIEAINNETTGILKQAKDYADGKDAAIKSAQDAADAAQGEVDALELVVGAMYTNTQIDEAIAAAQKTATYDDTELRGKISANEAAAKKAQDEVDALEQVVAGMYTNDAIDTAVAAAKKAGDDAQSAVDTLAQTVADNETDIEAKVKAIADDYLKAADKDALQDAIDANADAITAHANKIDNVVDTLVGTDTGKSVRTIANEELAAQLLSGDAEADFQTLQELAAWLEDHPEDVAAINLDIENLEKLVGTLPEGVTATTIAGYVAELVAAEESRAKGIESGLETRLQAVEGAMGEGGSVETQITNAIAALDADVKSADVEAGKGVQVQVVEVDGVITTVAVTGNYDEAYDAKGAAATAEANAAADATTKANTAESNAKTYADGLNTDMDGRVDTLEGLVGDGYQAIPEADINALFA